MNFSGTSGGGWGRDSSGNTILRDTNGNVFLQVIASGSVPSDRTKATLRVDENAGDFVISPGMNVNLINPGSLFFGTDTNAVPGIQVVGTVQGFDSKLTKGEGVAVVYGAGVQTLNTNAAPTTLSYTPASVPGVYRVSGFLNILTGGTLTFKAKITYKDAGGNAVTDIPVFIQQNSATLLVGGPTANTTGRFYFSSLLSTDNSATAIAIADNAGTYTAGTYYWNPIVERLA